MSASAVALSERPTGPECAAALRAAAARAGQSLNQFAGGIALSEGSTFIKTLERTSRPKPHTVARIRARLAGERLPELPPSLGAGMVTGVPVPELPPARDPCFRCGTRSDLGCRHQRVDAEHV